MYAVIETGGKQYRVEVGTELEVELLDVEPGKTVTIDRVLLVADGDESTIGRPLVADASVSAEVVTQTRGPKLISFKYRPKARSRVKKGHRQELTVLRIADITFGGKSAAKAAKKADDEAKTEQNRARGGRRGAGSQGRRARRQACGRCRRREGDDEGRREAEDGDEGQGRHRRDRDRDQVRSQDREQDRGTEEVDRQGRRRRGRRRSQGEGGRTEEAPRHEEGRVDEMAHKKAGGSVKNGRDSVGQRLGVKAGDGQLVSAGSIIVRQRGMTFLSGPGTGLGHDYTVFATVTGKVKFEHATKSKKRIRVEAVETTAASA